MLRRQLAEKRDADAPALARFLPPRSTDPCPSPPIQISNARTRPLILAIGNKIMSDDGVGPALAERLAPELSNVAEVVDGGTCGLALLPLIEQTEQLVVLDAARFGNAVGTVNVVEGEAMDRALSGIKSTAHEVALADLLDAAATIDALPPYRALVSVEPGTIRVGTDLSPPVAAALAQAEDAVRNLIESWSK